MEEPDSLTDIEPATGDTVGAAVAESGGERVALKDEDIRALRELDALEERLVVTLGDRDGKKDREFVTETRADCETEVEAVRDTAPEDERECSVDCEYDGVAVRDRSPV